MYHTQVLTFKRMLCNSLMQPHFDFVCRAWYPNLTMSLKNNLLTAQNACIIFCLRVERRSHIGLNHFQKTNGLPVKNRVDQCIVVTVYNFKNNLSPVYMSDINTLNSSPVVMTKRSDSFIQLIWRKYLWNEFCI